MAIDRGFRRAQALVEMALGLFALALVLSTSFAFTRIIVRSLDMQREHRVKAGRAALASTLQGSYSTSSDADEVEVEPYAAEYLFGTEKARVEESVSIPPMAGIDIVGNPAVP